MSHAPGPWFVEEKAQGWKLTDADGALFMGGPIVGEDNARLISAAPDQHEALLEARRVLQGLSDRWSFTPKDSLPVLDSADITEIREALRAASDAIDKAHGREVRI